MVDVWLPYGKTEVCARIPTRNFLGSIEPKEKPAVTDAEAEVKRALEQPIGSETLSKIVKPENKVAIVVNDIAKPDLANIMVSSIIEKLNAIGVKNENVRVIFGCEAPERIINEEFLKQVKTVRHDFKGQDLAYAGKTKHGTNVYLNKAFFAEADVKILTGEIRFHCYAGYGGGRKSVLPGVCGEETIRHDHTMILDSQAKKGVLSGNPIHEDMIEAAKLAKVDFILNVVTNSKGEIVKAFAGDLEQAFYEGVKLVDETYRISVDRRADVVVVGAGGYPADSSLYRVYEAVDSALRVVKRGGLIILAAECREGYGNQTFYDWMVKFKNLKDIERKIKRKFAFGGQTAYHLMKALQKVEIILVSAMPDYYATDIFRLKTARAVNDALNEAFNIAGKKAKVWVMPYGNLTLPEVKTSE